jgi:hypothetical protein
MARIVNAEGTLNAYNICGDEIHADDRYGYKVIAVIYFNKMWRAYRGLTDWSDERVAAEGDEISVTVAEQLFPTIAQTHTWC